MLHCYPQDDNLLMCRSRSLFLPIISHVQAALADPAAVLAAAIAVWSVSTLPLSPPPFSLTFVGSTLLVLRASRPAFALGVSVSIGGFTCSGTDVSSDGLWLITRTPSQSQMCDDAGNCGDGKLVITNPASVPTSSGGSGRRAAAAAQQFLGASLDCPPFCPGLLADNVVPVAASGTNGSFVPASVQTTSSGGRVVAPIDTASIAEATTGIFYARSCSATGIYTDPTTGACTNVSDPRASRCAFGSGDACQSCPTGALCPGGSRAWPRPGYYSASQSLPVVLPCPPPDPALRCTGWNPATGRTQCGEGYRQGSYKCESCAEGSYAPGDGSCRKCPVITGPWDRYSGLIIIFGVLVAFAVGIYLGLLCFIRAVGGTVSNGLKNVLTLMIWLVMTVQIVSQVSRVVSTSVPPLLATIYRGVALIQLQGIILPPACTGAYAFEQEVAINSFGLALTALFFALYFIGRSGKLRKIAGYVLTAAVLLLPMAAEASMGLMSCVSVELTPGALAVLDGGAALAAKRAAKEITAVRLLSSDPYFVCWAPGGSHAPAGYLSIATFLCYVVTLPVAVFVFIWRDAGLRAQTAAARAVLLTAMESNRKTARVAPAPSKIDVVAQPHSTPAAASAAQVASEPPAADSSTPASDPALGPFLSTSGYAPQAFYMRHVDLAAVLSLTVLQVFIPRPALLDRLVAKVVVTCIVLLSLSGLLLVLRPYARGVLAC
jgi:hypothetical protein